MLTSPFSKAMWRKMVQALQSYLFHPCRRLFDRSPRPSRKFTRLSHILALAVMVMALNVVSYTLASSLFVSQVGSDGLPISYVLVGLASTPVYGAFARVAGRVSHPLLFRYWSVAAAGVALLLRVLLFWDVQPVYYALYVGVYFQWTLQLDILLPTLISDYFTSREYNRRAPFITMAQAIGGLLGGGLVSFAAEFLATPDILLLLPVLYLIVLAQVWNLERCEKPIPPEEATTPTDEPPPSVLHLVKQYPIVKYLASSAFLWVILYAFAEYLYFGVYADRYQNDPQGLTGFLGGFSATNSALQLVVLFVLTRTLIDRLGVARTNLLYPASTFLSFVGLTLFRSFPTAVLAHFNNATLDTAINQPAYTLTYNPIPNRYVGKVRAVTDGLCYALGLGVAGGMLWVVQHYWDTSAIAAFGTIASALFLGVRYQLGQSYYRSLLAGLRSKTDQLDLEAVREGLIELPEDQSAQLRQMIERGDRKEKKDALELATYLQKPSRLLTEIDALVSEADMSLRRSLLRFFSKTTKDENVAAYLQECLGSENTDRQLMAFEALIARRETISIEDLHRLNRSDLMPIQGLVCVAAQQRTDLDDELRCVCTAFWQSEMDDDTKKVVIRGIRHTGNPDMIPQLRELLQDASVEVQIEVLKGMAELTPEGDATLGEMATRFLEHPSPQVRVAAIELLGAVRLPEFWEYLARGLEDFDVNVRLKSAMALTNYEEYNLEVLAKTYMFGPRADVSEAAVAAVAGIQTSQALHLLEDYLQADYRQADRLQMWWQRVPTQLPQWKPLLLVFQDRSQRIVNRVFHVLSCLGSRRALIEVRQMLHARDERKRANAVETLASIPHRRYIMPILPLVEYPEGRSRVTTLEPETTQSILREMLLADDRWVRVGALLVWVAHRYPMPGEIARDRDSVVKRVMKEAFSDSSGEVPSDAPPQLSVDRVFFLKAISLFRELSLDELWSLDRGFQHQYYREGDTVCQEGEIGNTLYLVYRGELRVSVADDSRVLSRDRLVPGDYFGDSGLFGEIPYRATVTTTSDVILLCLTKDSFNVLIDVLPKLPSCFAFVSLESEI
ncbi:MAG: MFS transporter [Cyanobacteria bacterium SID2]|nr:MFS transporter [Cyanobacteria bacterium SID2]